MRSTTVTLFLTANVDAPGPDSPVSDATTAAADKLLGKEVSASSRTRCCYGESSHTPPCLLLAVLLPWLRALLLLIELLAVLLPWLRALLLLIELLAVLLPWLRALLLLI